MRNLIILLIIFIIIFRKNGLKEKFWNYDWNYQKERDYYQCKYGRRSDNHRCSKLQHSFHN